MPDENQSIVSWLMGKLGGEPQGKTYLAPPRQNYPTDEDVNFARKYDYSYGQPWAPEFEDHSARLVSGGLNQRPLKSELLGTDKTTIDKLIPGVTDPLKNYYAKAALAAEGSGLAKLGFDPDRAALDPFRNSEDITAVGAYIPKHDQIYANIKDTSDPSVLMHESMHRGLQKLHDSPFWRPEFDEIMNDPDMNEYMVRHLMHTKMGDPEAVNTGAAGKAQQAAAQIVFGRNPRKQELLDRIEAAAAQAAAAKRPGGPR